MMKMWIHKYLTFVYLILTILSSVNAQSGAGAVFLLIPPSPTMNGLGGIGVGFPSDDPYAVFYNPANGLRNYTGVGMSYAELHTHWLPSLADDLWLDYSVTGLGIIPRKFPLQLVISQQREYLDLGEQYRTGDHGQIISSFHAYMQDRALSVGIGTTAKIGGQPIYIAGGWTRKKAVQVLADLEVESKGRSENIFDDYGLLIALPFTRTQSTLFRDVFQLSLTPAIGYSISNVGGSVTFIDPDQADPSPRLARLGLSLAASLSMNPDWTIMEWRGGRAVKDLLIDTSDPDRHPLPYQSGLGDISFTRHIVKNIVDDNVEIGRGDEITAFECFSFRRGRQIYIGAGINITTDGYGVRLDGILKFLTFFTGKQRYRNLARFIDIQYNYSRWTEYPGHPLHDTEFKSVKITLKNLERLFSKEG